MQRTAPLQTLALFALMALLVGCSAEVSPSSSEDTGSDPSESSDELEGVESGDTLESESDADSPEGGEEYASSTGEALGSEDETGSELLEESGEETAEETAEETGEETEEDEGGDLGQEWEDGTELLPLNPEDPLGTITIEEVDTLFGSGDSAHVSAGFHAPPLAPDPMETHGDCRVDFFDPAVEGLPPSTLNAGLITIQGLLLPAFLHAETTVEGPLYESNLTGDTLDVFDAPGTPLSISSNGGLDIPAFTGVLTTPTPVALVEPATGIDKSINTAKPLLISWNADKNASRMVLFLAVLDYAFEPIAGPVVTCVLEGDPGSHVVPAEALQNLPTKFLHKVVVSVTRVHEETLTSTLIPITLIATRTTAGIANAN